MRPLRERSERLEQNAGTPHDGWRQMLVAAGGENIFGTPQLAGQPIDPEKALTADADLIVKTTSGRALKNTGVDTL